MKKKIINGLITLGIGFCWYFIYLPPLNVTSMQFWTFVMTLIFIYVFLSMFKKIDIISLRNGRLEIFKTKKLLLAIFVIPVMIMLVNFVLSPIFNSKAFSERINIVSDTEESNFISEVKEVDIKL